MKKLIILIAITTCFAMQGFAQNYLSIFGDTSTSWDIISYGACDFIVSQTYNVTSDTNIFSKNYKIIPNYGFLREDTVLGKVWFYDTIMNNDYLVMDLSLNLGDTFVIYNYNIPNNILVDSVYYINGIKYIRLNAWISLCSPNLEKITFIEGSGTNAAFNYQTKLNGDNVSSYMLCHHKNGIKVKGNELFNDLCIVNEVGVAKNYEENTCKIFPNPFSYEALIFCNQSKIAEISIFDLTGKQILTIKGNGSSQSDSYRIKITRNGLKSGFYLAKVLLKNNLQYEVKLIIN